MDPVLNRRQWLKAGAMTAAGLLAGGRFAACSRERGESGASAPDPGAVLRLHSNESPYGISQATREALIKAASESHIYPDERYPELKRQIAEKEGVTPEHIVLGAGSTEVMTALIELGRRKGRILATDPTYFDFLYYADLAGCPVDGVPLNGEFAHDLDAMERRIGRDTGLVYVCNPNNPTGSITPAGRLREFCGRAAEGVPVVVDEAYHDYAEGPGYASMVDQVREGRNVVVIRTFSKVYGMAGLRVGYGIARPEIVEELDRLSRNFAPVACTSLAAAVAAYRDTAFVERVVRENRAVREFLCGELERRGFYYVPSRTNFVLFRVNQEAEALAREFEAGGVLVRPFTFSGSQWIRVSLGTMAQVERFLSLLPRPS
jgi:histidinol-phosphate aminotransferase